MYRLYAVKITKLGPPGLVITTAFEKAGEYYGETFCVFPAPCFRERFSRIMADREAFEVVSIDPTEEFMLNEALDQARMDILYHIEREYYEKGFLLSPDVGLLDSVGVEFLTRFQRGGMREDLLRIYEKTGCGDLRQALLPIIGLPVLIKIDWDF